MIQIRRYTAADAPELWQLKHATIWQVNCRDYAEDQLRAWAPKEIPAELWQKRADGMNPYVAVVGEEIVGFADVQADGYVDHFFCHSGWQGKGVGRLLMDTLLADARSRGLVQMYSHVSITARPFFEHFGFSVEQEQQVQISHAVLTNYRMVKRLG